MQKCAALCSLLLAATNAFGLTGYFSVYVDAKAPAGGDGRSWNTAFNNLHDALDTLKNPALYPPPVWDVRIKVAGGTYKPDRGTGDRSASFDFTFAQPNSDTLLFFEGGYAGRGSIKPDVRDLAKHPTVLSGDLNGDDGPEFANRVDNSELIARLDQGPDYVEINGFVFSGGNRTAVSPDRPFEQAAGLAIVARPEFAGKLRNPYRVVSCVFRSNRALVGSGAAVSAYSPRVSVLASTFTDNVAEQGDGGAVAELGYPDSLAVASGNVFESNRSQRGGAIFFASAGTVHSCVFARNRAEIAGGAVFNPVQLSVSALVRNSAGVRGGAVATTKTAQVMIDNCTIAENSAPEGPALSLDGSPIRLNCSIVWGHGDGVRAISLKETTDIARFIGSVLQAGVDAVSIIGSVVEPGFVQIINADPRFIRPASACGPESTWMDWNYRISKASAAESLGTGFFVHDLDIKIRTLPTDAGAYYGNTSTCTANLSRADNFVNDLDFVAFAAAYAIGVVPLADPWADFTRDGLVDAADFSAFAVAYDQMICP